MNNNKGIAIFISLSLLFLLSLVVIVVMLTSYNYFQITEKQIKRTKAIAWSEAGLSYAYYKLRVDPANYTNINATRPTELNSSGVILNVTWDGSNNSYTIKSKVVY
jgi:Tfp pilus assembly protein PilX